MRLTRAGIGLVCTTAVCFGLGRIFGLEEFFYLAGIGGSTLALGAILTMGIKLDLAVERTATPSRLRVDNAARIDLSIHNRSRRRTPVLALVDSVQGSTGAALSLAPIHGNQATSIAYRLPTRQRGLLNVGPLDITIGDPLGLTKSVVKASGVVQLVVHPELVDLGELRAVAGHDPTAAQQKVRSPAVGGDEFFALRPYVVGDDLRRVNWRASARSDELVVRQQERPQTGRVTVILDTRSSVYTDEGFERAVSAALSALHAGWRGGDSLRFLTSGSGSFTDIRSRAELNVIDEQLALIEPTQSASLVRSIDEACKVGRGGTLVVFTGRPLSELPASIDSAGRRYSLVATILCEPTTDHMISSAVVHDGETPLAEMWHRAMSQAQAVSQRGARR